MRSPDESRCMGCALIYMSSFPDYDEEREKECTCEPWKFKKAYNFPRGCLMVASEARE